MIIISKIIKFHLIRKNVNIFNNYSTKIDATKHYDIIIAGGGMVGTTLACLLGKNKILSNKRILLLEAGKNKPYTLAENYNNRVVSINPANKKLFNEIGVWEFIKQARTAKVESLQVWDALSDSFITFGGEDNAENVSYIVENDLILAAVLEQLNNDCNNVEIQYEAKIKDVHLPEYEENIAKVTLANNEEECFTCDLLF